MNLLLPISWSRNIPAVLESAQAQTSGDHQSEAEGTHDHQWPKQGDNQDYGMPPGAANGHEGFRTVLGGFCTAFPDLHLSPEFMVSDGDRLVCYLTTTGTHKAPFMGAPATGKTFRVNGTNIFRFDDDGKVAEHWGVFDTFGMMMQLGLTSLPHSEPG